MTEMSNDEEMLARRACAAQALRYVRQLYAPNTEDYASGVAVKIEGHYFIATVRHVLEKATSVEITSAPAERKVAGSFRSIIWSSSLDLGLIELTEGQANCLPAFAGLDNILATSKFEKDTALFVIGFPASNYSQAWPYRCFWSTTYDTVPLLMPQWPDSLWPPPSEDTDILLDLPDETENRWYGPGLPAEGSPPAAGTPPPPIGMSGGGIWRAVWHKGPVLRPGVQFVGIQCRFFEKSRLLRGHHIKCWLEFVLDNYPELTETIEQMLAKTMDFERPRDQG